MRFGILGPLDVRSPTGEAISVGGPRPRALLVMLLLNADRVVGVEQLIDGQYGDDPPPGAANALQAQVSRLRRSLPAELVEFHGSGYRLAIDPDDVDAHRFERLAREGRRQLAAGLHPAAADLLREALGLWRGAALADLPFGQAQAARLEELRLAAAEDLAEAELALPEGASVADLRRLAAAHPLRERLTGQLMRALYAAGRQAEALAVFEETRRLLAEELGADPSPELAEVHLAVLRAERSATAPRRLAAQLSSFVGREQELARIDGLRDSRLITIIGPGGTGKTRLAIEAAGRGRHEVCFADLSPLRSGTSPLDSASSPGSASSTGGASPFDGASSPGGASSTGGAFPSGGDQVPQAILDALGLRETGFQPLRVPDPTERLVSALAGRELLLILDNCEHVVTAAATLARRLLGECPGLSVLATSREPLGITGETLVPLAPLDTPPPDSPPSAALSYPAVRLFADRAAAVQQGFEVRRDNVETVTRICATLDGLPLAIELAAARLRTFTVEEIAARLAEHGRFRLLSRGDRTAAARHRTLRAVVEWSWDLLTPAEQALARRFTVFAGSASLEAVEEVCGMDDAAELLADLVDKSLVETDGDRYRMLDTIGLFCAEKLDEAGERERLHGAHARYFLDLAQRADPHLRRAEQLRWLERLSAEHGNLMAALRRAVREDRETALRLIAALAAYWWLSGRRSHAGEAAAELLDAIGLPPAGLAEEYVMCVTHAVPRAGPEHWERAGAIMGSLDRPARHPFTVALWGMVAGPSGAVEPGSDRLFGSDPWNLALGRLSMALLAVLDGDPAGAEKELRESLARFRSLGERWGTAQGLDWLALIASRRGEWARARELWGEAVALLEELGALEETADVLERRAEGLVREGDLAAAAIDYRRAEELTRKAGRPDVSAGVHLGLGGIARLEGDLAGARLRLDAALKASETGTFGADGARARVLTALGRLAGAEDDPAETRRRHRQALASARRSPLTTDIADAVEGQAEAVLSEGAGERAALLLGVAVALRGMSVAGDRDVARVAAGARDLAGAEAFASAFARGAAMRRDEALKVLDGESGESGGPGEDAEWGGHPAGGPR
ncbi:winged helix-turn-helix domain-containing protein [Streptosporangium sp. NBC_01639]|uniref:BTAD domain-containing putative transcriptional regulator n=1 Tax=Streptosporangium sp. NBC_01639 TaxID=2975948 RepID=UPI00386E3B9E|nr:winged helix-turn-helix domain-containing protein [Streptosporangium sp. NBC_01639]